MHVYLREEAVHLTMREVDPEGLVPEDAELLAVAFYVNGNDQPSFRSLLPPDTVALLHEALGQIVQLGLLAEEPDDPSAEVRAMVGISIPIEAFPEGEGAAQPAEPWQSNNPDAWKGEAEAEDEVPRTALLTFAPLVRLQRKHPRDFGEELADLLEAALAGATRPSLQARVDQMLGDV